MNQNIMVSFTTTILALLQSFLFVAAAIEPVCEELKNSAFVFVKPHANTVATQELVKSSFAKAGISIIEERSISGETIDQQKLIDQHYYAIASKATILSPKELSVPAAKFQEAFGEEWSTVLEEDRASNALDACQRFQCTPQELNDVWMKTKAVKFGGGFYCALLTFPGSSSPPLYVFNAFFMAMRQKFVAPGSSIHAYVVEWDASHLSWKSFRRDVLG